MNYHKNQKFKQKINLNLIKFYKFKYNIILISLPLNFIIKNPILNYLSENLTTIK
jgi:hypothetical protein